MVYSQSNNAIGLSPTGANNIIPIASLVVIRSRRKQPEGIIWLWRNHFVNPPQAKAKLWEDSDVSRFKLTLSLCESYQFKRTTKEWKRVAMRSIRGTKKFNHFAWLRLRALWTARQMAFWGVNPRRYESRCPRCDRTGVFGNGEDHTRLLLECPVWDVERERYFGASIREATGIVLYDKLRLEDPTWGELLDVSGSDDISQ